MPDAEAEDDDVDEQLRAEFTTTTRGRDQLIFCGQPFIYEKGMQLANGVQKKMWRCNQWWNKRCRARVYTIGDLVTPLNKYHTHEDIIKRKKRVSRGRRPNQKTLLARAEQTQASAAGAAVVGSAAKTMLTLTTTADGRTIGVLSDGPPTPVMLSTSSAASNALGHVGIGSGDGCLDRSYILGVGDVDVSSMVQDDHSD